MDIPNSPLQMAHQSIIGKLDELPEDSVVTLSIDEFRAMVMRQLQLHDIIASQSKLLKKHVPDY